MKAKKQSHPLRCQCCHGPLGIVFRYDHDLDGYTCLSCANSLDLAEMQLALLGFAKFKPKQR